MRYSPRYIKENRLKNKITAIIVVVETLLIGLSRLHRNVFRNRPAATTSSIFQLPVIVFNT